MVKKWLITIFWMIGLITLSGSLHGDELTDLITGKKVSKETEAPKPDKIITVDTPTQSDKKIRKRLQEIFAELDDLQKIKILVRNGIVTLQGEVSAATTETKAVQFAEQVEGVVEVVNELVVTHSVEKRLETTWQKLVKSSKELVASLPLFLLALLVFVLFWMVGRWISHHPNLYRRVAPNYFIANLLGQVTQLAFILLGLILALVLLDLTALLGTILGAAGIIGLAVGFAVRDTVENYIASILLSLRNPFEVNDLVNIGGSEGNVARLTARATILISLDGNHVRIPNSAVFKAVIINFTRNPERRFQFDVGIDVEQNLLEAQALVLETLTSTEGVLSDPKPMALIEKLGDFNVVMRIYGWMNQDNYNFFKIRSEAIRRIKQAFDKANIVMPEPIYQVRMSEGASQNLTSGDNIDQEVPLHRPDKTIRSSPMPTTADLTADQTIKKKVAKEHAQDDTENLLSTSAPKE